MASGSGSSKTISRVQILSREVKLTYLQSVQVYAGEQDEGQLAGEGGGIGTVSASSSEAGSPGFLGIGASGGSASTRTSNDTGWIIQRTWLETHFNRNRYGIGIKDIGIFHYRFGNIAELVSVPFSSPKEIYKVQMRVVEQIPAAYPIDETYILYYISVDDGETWHQINPLDHPVMTADDGQVVPRTITFNPEIGGIADELNKYVETADPVYAVRYRAVLRGAEGIIDADRYTPVLKRVRVMMYPKGGL